MAKLRPHAENRYSNLFHGMLDRLLLKLLAWQKRRTHHVHDIDRPVRLMAEFRRELGEARYGPYDMAAQVLGKSVTELDRRIAGSTDYDRLRRELDSKMKAFDKQPYQCGALDLEMDVIVAILEQFEQPEVLEVGVANGYSSAFLYHTASIAGGRITSIDLPRYATALVHWSDRVRELLVRRGKITNTGTLGDLNPGGIIPATKYGGWLVPMDLRLGVSNVSICGDVRNVLAELPREQYDLAIVDAGKNYEFRRDLLDRVLEHLRPGGVGVLDGYWVNSAFEDFCSANGLPSFRFGRIGVFSRPSRA